MATLKDARDKAKASKFKQEIGQFVRALELYRADNTKYPGEGPISIVYDIGTNNQPIGSTALIDMLLNYIPNLPSVINPNTFTNTSWGYRINGTNDPNFTNFHYRCEGDTTTPKYVIIVYNHSFNISTYNAVSDWPKLQQSFSLNNWSTLATNNKCFSFK